MFIPLTHPNSTPNICLECLGSLTAEAVIHWETGLCWRQQGDFRCSFHFNFTNNNGLNTYCVLRINCAKCGLQTWTSQQPSPAAGTALRRGMLPEIWMYYTLGSYSPVVYRIRLCSLYQWETIVRQAYRICLTSQRGQVSGELRCEPRLPVQGLAAWPRPWSHCLVEGDRDRFIEVQCGQWE